MYRVNKMIGSRCNRVFAYGFRRVAHLFHDSAAQQRSTAQRGSLLLEYMVVMVLALLTAMWAVSAWADKKEMLKIESQARWMQTLQQATEHYIEQYGHQLIKAEPNSAQWLRSEEHTSELQSRGHLVCRLLLEKKKQTQNS